MSEEKSTIVVDEEGGLRRLGGDREIYNELMDLFIDNAETQMQQLEAAVANNELDSIEKLAHSIKGAAANLGIMAVQETAQVLEQIGREKRGDDVDETYHQLVHEMERFRQYWHA
ncbi:Hpt domain-containing protein [candidate division KSB1 bacterium]|nr:Hpt domain-containing protein [candidate division KSB1 bacterium]